MDSRYTSVVSILLLSLISATVSETGYKVIFSRDDEEVRNTFTLRCQNTSTGLGLSNAKWFFNSTDYSSHPCTQDAVISGDMMDDLVLTLVPECEGYMQCGTDTILSLPRLLLSEFEIIVCVWLGGYLIGSNAMKELPIVVFPECFYTVT